MLGTKQNNLIYLNQTAQITDQGFAELLERRLKRIEEMKLVEAHKDTAPKFCSLCDATN